MRRPVKNRKHPEADRAFNSERISRLINYVMLDGKKTTAEDIVYNALKKASEKTKNEDVVQVLDTAIKNVAPTMEVRSRRVGGANYQVPVEVRAERRIQLAFRWIVLAARDRKGIKMEDALAEELVLAYSNEGSAVKKREDTHKMAEANKAFAHFAW